MYIKSRSRTQKASCELRLPWQLIPVIFAAAPFSGCSTKPASPAPMPTPVVICVAAQAQQVSDFDEFVGRTEPSETVDVQSRVSGFLETIDFEDGQMVAKGDLLATIEPDEYSAIHQQSLANIELWNSKLELAETTFERYKDLLAKNSVSKAEYDETEAAVKEARSQITAAKAAAAKTQLDLDYTRVYAPISGRTDRAYVTPGNVVNGGFGAGTLLTRIVNDTPMFAYIDVDEQSVLAYKRRIQAAGQSDSSGGALKELKIPCLIKLQDEGDYTHEGFLDFAENRIDGATGTIRLRAVLNNDDHFLTGGLFVRVKIPKGQPYAGVLIPEQCIATDQADKIAYVVNDSGKAELRILELGTKFGSMRSIVSGINADEKVVYQGIQKVRPGMPVQAEMTELDANTSSSAGTEKLTTPPADSTDASAPSAEIDSEDTQS